MKPLNKYAEECNYWKTSSSSPDLWIEKTVGLVEKFGGEVLSTGFGNEYMTGKAAYLIRFELDGEVFRIVWPVARSERGDTFAARRQAATMIFHDVKAKCVASQVLGSRTAFFPWLEIENGVSAYQLSSKELADETPQMLLPQPTGGGTSVEP